MKFLISTFTIILLMTASLTNAQTTITVTVANATSNEGKISYALYDAATFMKQPLQAKSSTIENGKSTVVFENIAAGEYAIICYHDANNNDTMDFQPNGMPLESYGASNNVMNFGPPRFNDAKFMVADTSVALEIKF